MAIVTCNEAYGVDYSIEVYSANVRGITPEFQKRSGDANECWSFRRWDNENRFLLEVSTTDNQGKTKKI